MPLQRFSVSLDAGLMASFDRQLQRQGYPTRSKAVGDLIREKLVEQEWSSGTEVAGAITMVFDHHRRELVNKLTAIQHRYHGLVISSQHTHLDHDNCFEVVVARGKPGEIEKLYRELKAAKGVKHCVLSAATTGKEV